MADNNNIELKSIVNIDIELEPRIEVEIEVNWTSNCTEDLPDLLTIYNIAKV